MGGNLQSRALVPLSVAEHDGCGAGEDERQRAPAPAALLDTIAAVLIDHIVLPKGGPEAIALWVPCGAPSVRTATSAPTRTTARRSMPARSRQWRGRYGGRAATTS